MEPKQTENDQDAVKQAPFLRRKVKFDFSIPIFNRLRIQLIVPYVLLTLILAMVGVFVVTRLVTSSVQERFVNQLFEASRSVSDGFVRYEQDQLASLRLMTYSEGVSTAVQRDDADTLQSILWPLMVNNEQYAAAVIDRTGDGIITLVQSGDQGEYVVSYGEDFGRLAMVDAILAGEYDERGDKFTEMVSTNDGPFVFTGGPIPDENGRVLGVLLVGTPLEHLLSSLKAQALADIFVFDDDGRLLASTLLIPYDQVPTLEQDVEAREGEDITDTEEIRLSGRRYEVAYSPWLLRENRIGSLAIALPSNFVVSTMATSRNSFSFIFALGTVAMMFLGLRLSQSIAKPILRMRTVSQAVAAGDLEQSTGVEREDEIGELAVAFDVMTARLKERTEEAERLYAQMVERNLELAEINDRLQRTRAQLVQSEKLAAVGQLTAGIVHDVKNPLAVIKGLAEEIEEENEFTPFTRDSLGMIRDSASKANMIVTDLLKFARQSTPTLEPRDLRETMNSSLRLTEYLTRKAGVRVTSDFPDKPVMARIDSQQIEQVLINLITNAVQAMPDGGELRARISANHESVKLSIGDSGSGIPEEDLPRIFDPFFTTKPEGEGTGLGLSVSYGIMAQHGGRIDVESTVGEGSTFTLHLKPDSSASGEDEAAPQ